MTRADVRWKTLGLVLWAALLAEPAAGAASVSAATLDPLCAPLALPATPLLSSHWHWSGIFPLYGGWIPDPHISCNQPLDAPPSVARALGESAVRIQLAYLNPFFQDDSSQIMIVLASERSVRAVRVDSPEARRGVGSAGDLKPHLRSFVAGGRVYVLVSDLPINALIRVPEPAQALTTPINVGSKDFESVIAELAASPEAVADAVTALCEPVAGEYASLAAVWLGGCPNFDFQKEFKTEPFAMYERVWLRPPARPNAPPSH